ncbi:Uncharacterised protein [Nocardia brasiliensis]|nr:Uncharacterised protein [Nocardia brasiliensis]
MWRGFSGARPTIDSVGRYVSHEPHSWQGAPSMWCAEVLLTHR